MKPESIRRVFLQEDLNFLLTNRIPRIAVSRWMGRLSRIDSPLLTRGLIAIWRVFTDLDLAEAKPRRYRSLRECFTRQLKDGARSFHPDPGVLCSPSDGIVGACGELRDGQLLQAKGMPYTLSELFGPTQPIDDFTGGVWVTLRLTSAMYHRFHAPHDVRVDHVTHIDGDTWNVNPIALKRVERLFCRNERAVIRARIGDAAWPIAIVPVAAILVAGIRLHGLDLLLTPRRIGPTEYPCELDFARGEEMGWFEHGSTILVFAPRGFRLAEGLCTGSRIRAGEPLMCLPEDTQRASTPCHLEAAA
jgi:phosphatidylserine decarboxylase